MTTFYQIPIYNDGFTSVGLWNILEPPIFCEIFAKKKSVKNWAGEALKMPTVNYLQRETQTRPVFKTYRMVRSQPSGQNINFCLGHEKWDKSG